MKNQKVRNKGTRLSTDTRRIVLESLLAGESQDAAAAAAGITRRTIYRWLADPGFKNELEKARTAAFNEALNGLKGGAAVAVKTLLKILTSKSTSEQRQAAKEILTFAFKGVETLDFEARLEKIEKLIEEGGVPFIGRGVS